MSMLVCRKWVSVGPCICSAHSVSQDDQCMLSARGTIGSPAGLFSHVPILASVHLGFGVLRPATAGRCRHGAVLLRNMLVPGNFRVHFRMRWLLILRCGRAPRSRRHRRPRGWSLRALTILRLRIGIAATRSVRIVPAGIPAVVVTVPVPC